MYDIRLKALYNENITRDVTITGSESSNGTTSHYYGENVSINVGEKDGYTPLITISPDDIKNTSSDINTVEFTMPDKNVSISVNFILDKYLPRLTLTAEHKNLLGYTGEANEHVTIPSTLKVDDTVYRVAKMEYYAFKDCPNISSVTIEPGVSYIAGFENCTNLTSVTIPDTVAIIESSTFKGCTSLKEINIPDSVVDIGFWAFTNCPASINIDRPSGSISTLLWENKGTVKWLRTPFTVTSSNINSFKSNKTVKIPYRFTGTDGVEYEVTGIETGAFVDSSDVQLVELPYSIKQLPENIFSNCTKLTSIVVDGYPEVVTGAPWGATNANVTYNRSCMEISYDGEIYVTDHVCRDNIEFTVIPEEVDGIKVTGIAANGFAGLSNLKSVFLSDSVKTINNGAFKNCILLGSVRIPDEIRKINDETFRNCPKISVSSYMTEIGSYAYEGCQWGFINHFMNITKIGTGAFQNSRYRDTDAEIHIYDSIQSIGSNAFNGITGVKSIYIMKPENSISGAPWGAPSTVTINWKS